MREGGCERRGCSELETREERGGTVSCWQEAGSGDRCHANQKWYADGRGG